MTTSSSACPLWQRSPEGEWSNRDLGQITPLPDGKWLVTNPAGEQLEPYDDADHAKRSLEYLWGGWVKTDERQWVHPRYGEIRDEGNERWYCAVMPRTRANGDKGPFQRASFAIAESRRLSPLVLSVRAMRSLDSFMWMTLVALSMLAFPGWAVLVMFAIAISGFRALMDDRFESHRYRVAHAVGEAALFVLAWRYIAPAMRDAGVSPDPMVLVAPLVAVTIGVICARLMSMLAFAMLGASGPRYGVPWAPIPEDLKATAAGHRLS